MFSCAFTADYDKSREKTAEQRSPRYEWILFFLRGCGKIEKNNKQPERFYHGFVFEGKTVLIG